MNWILHLPVEEIDKFRCSLCNNHLSYFPISSLIEENENVCGRCAIPEDKIAFHNRIFEEIAKHIKFPCRYKQQGCSYELSPTEAPSHEAHCHHKLVECPCREMADCSWKGTCNGMLSHCRRTHEDLFLQERAFEINLTASNSLERFLEHDGTLFAVSLSFWSLSTTLTYAIHQVEEEADSENRPYQLVLRRDKKRIIVENATTTFADRKTSEIALDSLTKNADRSLITGYIAFDEEPVFRKRLKQVLSCLKCSRCEAPTLPAKNLVKTYDIQCGYCSSTNKLEFPDVDDLSTLHFSCEYKKNGCDVVLKSKKMRNHLLTCQFKDETCFLWRCGWSGLRKGFAEHVLESHRDMIVENGMKITFDGGRINRIIRYNNHLFLLGIMMDDGQNFEGSCYRYTYTVVSLTSEEQFQYRIEFVNVKENKLLSVQSGECVVYNAHLQTNNEAYCTTMEIKTPHRRQNVNDIAFRVRILKQSY